MISLVRMNTLQLNKKAIKKKAFYSCDLLQMIIDSLPIRIFWKDKNLLYLGGNKIFAKDAGKNSPKDLIGKNDFQLSWKDQAEAYRSDDQKVIDSGNPKLDFQETQTNPKGEIIWLKTSKVPLLDSQGEIVGVLGAYEDVTEKKQNEEIIKKNFEEIKKMNNLMIGRELKMIELKKELEKLKSKIS